MVKLGYNVIDNQLIFITDTHDEVLCGIWDNNEWKMKKILKIMDVLTPEDFEAAQFQPYDNMVKWMEAHTKRSL